MVISTIKIHLLAIWANIASMGHQDTKAQLKSSTLCERTSYYHRLLFMCPVTEQAFSYSKAGRMPPLSGFKFMLKLNKAKKPWQKAKEKGALAGLPGSYLESRFNRQL